MLFLSEKGERINGERTGSPPPQQPPGSNTFWNSSETGQCADLSIRGGAGPIYCSLPDSTCWRISWETPSPTAPLRTTMTNNGGKSDAP